MSLHSYLGFRLTQTRSKGLGAPIQEEKRRSTEPPLPGDMEGQKCPHRDSWMSSEWCCQISKMLWHLIGYSEKQSVVDNQIIRF
ncbi:hypothetical protein GN956_G12021 [Arapaima gigas]